MYQNWLSWHCIVQVVYQPKWQKIVLHHNFALSKVQLSMSHFMAYLCTQLPLEYHILLHFAVHVGWKQTAVLL